MKKLFHVFIFSLLICLIKCRRYCNSYGGKTQVVTYVYVVGDNNYGGQCLPGDTKIGVDLNEGAGGDWIYFCVRYETLHNDYRVGDQTVLTSASIDTNGYGTGDCPGYVGDGSWSRDPYDLNRKAGGEWLYLCTRRQPNDATSTRGCTYFTALSTGNSGSMPGGCYYKDLNENAGGSYVWMCPYYDECDGCINRYSTASKCTACENHYDTATYCTDCKNMYSLASDCRWCEWGYTTLTSCTTCEHENLNLATECKTCVRTRYKPVDLGQTAGSQCRECLWGHDLGNLCQTCTTINLNFGLNCANCFNENYFQWGDDLVNTINYHASSSACATCKYGWDINTRCTQCMNGNYTLGCQSCRTHWYWNPSLPAINCVICNHQGWDINLDCNECIITGLDQTKDCADCRNDRYLMGDHTVFTMCRGCKGNYDIAGVNYCSKCLPGYYGWFCQHYLPDFEAKCEHGDVVINWDGSDPLSATGFTCNCHNGWVGDYCTFRCEYNDYNSCWKRIHKEEKCTPILIRAYEPPASTPNYKLETLAHYITGEVFGDCDDPAKKNCFRGLENIEAMTNDPHKMMHLKVTVNSDLYYTYSKSCEQFRLLNEDNLWQMDFSNCYGDDEINSADLYAMRGIPFSSKYNDYDQRDEESGRDYNCAGELGAGWWDDCPKRIHPFGIYGGSGDDRLRVSDLTEITYLEFSVCEYTIRETCTDLVVHEKGDISFEQPLHAYQAGFGDCRSGDCWRGMDYLYHLYSTHMIPEMKMKIEAGYEGDAYGAQFTFSLGRPEEGYKLTNLQSHGERYSSINPQDFLHHKEKKFQICANKGGFWYDESCSPFMGSSPTGVLGNGAFQGMYYTTLSYGESLESFNIQMCGSIHHQDRLTNEKLRKELEGEKCQPFLIHQSTDFSFARVWDDYVNGFGDCSNDADCWLGLENVHAITSGDHPKTLSIEVRKGERIYSLICYNFRIDDSGLDYRVHYDLCEGSFELESLFMESFDNQPFSTFDHSSGQVPNCAGVTGSGWWFSNAGGDSGKCVTDNFNPTGLLRSSDANQAATFPGGFTTPTDFVTSVKISLCGLMEEDIEYLEDNRRCYPFLVRKNEETQFDRTYQQYVNGFGKCNIPMSVDWNNPELVEPEHDCFIGLSTLRRLTATPQIVKVKVRVEGKTYSDFYCGAFQVEDSAEKGYQVIIENCVNDLENAYLAKIYQDFTAFKGNEFAAFDRDPIRDGSLRPPVEFSGGWFFGKETLNFRPTGVFGSEDTGMGINVYRITGYDSSVEFLELSLCQYRTRPRAAMKFGDWSCARDCDLFRVSPPEKFELQIGEQVYEFGEEDYFGPFSNVFTGPGEYSFSTEMKSFYSQVFNRPIIFGEEFLSYKDPDSGDLSQMMTVVQSCNTLEECGWGENVTIQSVFVPEGHVIVFSNQNVDADVNPIELDMYQIGGGGFSGIVDIDIDMPIKSFQYHISTELVDYDDPIIFAEPNFAGQSKRLVYDCKRSCSSVAGYQSLFVPEGYVVDVYQNSDFGGVSRKFVGPISIPRFDGYFENHNIGSYKSSLIALQHVEIEIIKFYFPSILEPVDQVETNINKISVRNPTAILREVVFEDSYETFEATSFLQEYLQTRGEESTTTKTFTSESFVKTSSNTNLAGDTEIAGGLGGQVSEVLVEVNAEVRNFYDYNDQAGSQKQTSSSVETSQTGYSAEQLLGHFEFEQETISTRSRTFSYTCSALPYTKTECFAMQRVAIFNIEYDAVQRNYYTNGDVTELPFRGVMEKQESTQVYFTTTEEPLEEFCDQKFFNYGGDCYRAIRLLSQNSVSDIHAGELTTNDVSYLPITFVNAQRMCFASEGSTIAAPQDSMTSYFLEERCNFDYPVLIGLSYFADTQSFIFDDNPNRNYTVESLPYFKSGDLRLTLPDVDSVVVLEKFGKWRFVDAFAEPEAICVVCKKEVGVQVFLDMEKTDINDIMPEQGI